MTDDDSDDHEKAMREYGWRRKCEIYLEIEEHWSKYLSELDYPAIDFVGYVAKNYDPPKDVDSARYLVWVWKFVRRYNPKHLN